MDKHPTTASTVQVRLPNAQQHCPWHGLQGQARPSPCSHSWHRHNVPKRGSCEAWKAWLTWNLCWDSKGLS